MSREVTLITAMIRAEYRPDSGMKLNRHGRVMMMEHHLNCWLYANWFNRRHPDEGATWQSVAGVEARYGIPLMSTAPENCQ